MSRIPPSHRIWIIGIEFSIEVFFKLWIIFVQKLLLDHSVHDREDDEDAVDNGDEDPVKAIEEPDRGVYWGCGAREIAGGAWTVTDTREISEWTILWDKSVAWVSVSIEGVWGADEFELDHWVGLLLAIEAHEVHEGDRTLKWCLSDKRDFLAGLEDSASVIGVKGEECDSLVTDIGVWIHLIVETLNELSLILIARVFTPHSLNVHRTDGAVKTENGVDLNKVCIY